MNPHYTRLYYDKQVDVEYGCIRYHYLLHDYPLYHDHDYYEFMVCFQGEYRHEVNGRSYRFKKLDSCLLFPTDAHALYEVEPDSSHYDIMIRKEAFDDFVQALNPHFFSIVQQPADGGVRQFVVSESRLKKIIAYLNEIRESEMGSEQQKLNCRFLLFNLIEPMFTQNRVFESGKRPQWLNDLLVEINRPSHLAWGVGDVVAHSNYSKTHLSRLFKEEMGKSIGEYLQEIKINAARDMLVNSDISLAELCDIIGHSSLSHFSSVFKQTYGMAPGRYRTLYRHCE